MMKRLLYGFLYGFMWLFASLPFAVLYFISDGLYLLLYHVLGYRKKVVRLNLKNSFPDKTDQERLAIEKRFYHYLCDYFVEEVKLLRISKEELLRRMKYINTDTFLKMVDKHGGIILTIPHYANFEWIIGMGMIMEPGDLPVQIYKPLRNKYFDQLFKDIRSRFGGYNVAKHDTVRELVKLKRAKKKIVVGLITDQSPGKNEDNHWTTFLNQDTVFMDGAERIAKMLNFPVFYCELTRVKRGFCEVDFTLLTEHPKQTAEGEITEAFVRSVENTIFREPPYWFWSHKRWKHVKPSGK